MPQKIKIIIGSLIFFFLVGQAHLILLSNSGSYQSALGLKPKYFRNTKILIPKKWTLLSYSDEHSVNSISYWNFGFKKYENEISEDKLKMATFYVFRNNSTKFTIIVVTPDIDSLEFKKLEKPMSLFSIIAKKQISSFFTDNELDSFETPLGEAKNIKNTDFIVISDHFLALKSTEKNEKIDFLKSKLKELKISNE